MLFLSAITTCRKLGATLGAAIAAACIRDRRS